MRKNIVSASLPAPLNIDPRAAQSEEAIGAALLRLLEAKSFDRITILEIVAEAGVHRATFSRRYASKEELLDQVAAAQIRQLVELTYPILETEGRYASTLVFCRYIDDHRSLWRSLLTGGAAEALREEWLRLSRMIAYRKHYEESWLPTKLLVRCSISLIRETIVWWLSDAPNNDAESIAQILHDITTSFSQPSEEFF